MGQNFRSLCRVENRKTLLWLMVIIIFVTITSFQYMAIRYGDGMSYMFSADNITASRNFSLAGDGSELLNHETYVDSNVIHEVADDVGMSEKMAESNKSSTWEEIEHFSNGSSVLYVEDVGKEHNVSEKENSAAREPTPAPALSNTLNSFVDYSDSNTTSGEETLGAADEENEEQDRLVHLNAPQVPNSGVVSISEMKHLLHQSRRHSSMRPRWPSTVDQELLYARTEIENAPNSDNDPVLHAPLYWNVSMFRRSYELMEKMLKVYIYKEGSKPIMHRPVLKGIYASEGWFMKQLKSSKMFATIDSRKAHLFYLPFSSKMLEKTLFVPGSHSTENLVQYLKNFLDVISSKYSFWNRTEGSDHFLVACHDWAPSETRHNLFNCIRSLCNSDVNEGFVFGKDASLPETTIRTPKKPLRALGGKPYSQRPILAFFAGRMHGYVRPTLLKHWGGEKDPDMKIFGLMPRSKNVKSYIEHMKSSKYCICAKGYEVNSPRVVEAIFYECVPVIISDNFVPPFFEVLNWESFAVFVLEKDIPRLKDILQSIPEERYREMRMRVKKVQKHFVWHPKPEKYDVFHMILHSVWYNRVYRI